jgi:hypothetical protein
MRKTFSVSTIFILFLLLCHANPSVSTSPEPQIGVKAGDWIKLNYTVTGSSFGLIPAWMKVEFLSVDTPQATVIVRMTIHMSNGTEQNQTGTTSLAGTPGNGSVIFSGLIIPANSTMGDSAYIIGYGNTTITGETVRTYVGATRGVIYANFSQQGNRLVFYWDKQTGVIAEADIVSATMNATSIVTETNMWQPQLFAIPIDPIVFSGIIVIIVLAATVIFSVWRKRHQHEEPRPNLISPA